MAIELEIGETEKAVLPRVKVVSGKRKRRRIPNEGKCEEWGDKCSPYMLSATLCEKHYQRRRRVELKKLEVKEKKEKEETILAQRFAIEYLKDFKPAEAVKRAGSTAQNPSVVATSLLRRPGVQELISKKVKELLEKTEVEVAWLIQATKRIVDFDPAQLKDENGNIREVDQLPVELRLAIDGVRIRERYNARSKKMEREYEYRFGKREGARDQLFRYYALYSDVGSSKNPLTTSTDRLDVTKLTADDLVQLSNMLKRINTPSGELIASTSAETND